MLEVRYSWALLISHAEYHTLRCLGHLVQSQRMHQAGEGDLTHKPLRSKSRCLGHCGLRFNARANLCRVFVRGPLRSKSWRKNHRVLMLDAPACVCLISLDPWANAFWALVKGPLRSRSQRAGPRVRCLVARASIS